MNPWPFIIASYVVGLGGTFALAFAAWRTMRRAEGEADSLGRRE